MCARTMYFAACALSALSVGCAGNPAAPTPAASAHAALKVTFGRLSTAITGLTQIQFDALGSTGEGLSYRIDFGDGQTTAKPVAMHSVNVAGKLTARLTVVDRAGRADSVEVPYVSLPLAFGPPGADSWTYAELVGSHFLRFDFFTGSGVGSRRENLVRVRAEFSVREVPCDPERRTRRPHRGAGTRA